MQLDFQKSQLMLIGRDPEMLGLLKEVLMSAGFSVDAQAADEFLRGMHKASIPTLLIYDETQPAVDAERIYYMLQENADWQEVPFMLLSDVYNGARIARCLDRGVAEFVDKPFDVDELAGRIRKVLRQQNMDIPGDQDGHEGFSGDLSFMGQPDLLITLHQNRRTGLLVLHMEDGEYIFWFKAGKLVYVEGPEGMSGVKPFNRAIRLFYGRFSFVPQDAAEFKPALEEDYGGIPNLILSAVQESDEYPLSRDKLPPDPILVRLSEPPESFSGDVGVLKPLVKGINEATIDELVRASPMTDLNAVNSLLEVFEAGLIVEDD